MSLVPDFALGMAQRITQLWKWAGFEHQKDFALAISDDETLMSKLKKGESLTTERVLRIAQECAGRHNVIDDASIVLLYLFDQRGEADVWVPSVRLVGQADNLTTSGSDFPGYPYADAA